MEAGPDGKVTLRWLTRSGKLHILVEDVENTRKALESGASKEEIAHAVLLALTTTGFPNMIAALQWVDEVLKDA